MTVFQKFDLLLPEKNLETWSVIACDQFTSQPEYWQKVKELTQGVPSSAHCIFPECDLSDENTGRITQIGETMRQYLREGIFRKYPDCFVYVERTQRDGSIRKGVVGALDLEAYDYSPTSRTPVRASEKTVPERIPPRMAIREGASLDLSHVLVLCDDEKKELIESLAAMRDSLAKLYDFDLMLEGGHIAGWLADGPAAEMFETKLAEYVSRRQEDPQAVLFAVGDGNHSLAAAKACYDACPTPLNRYALAELCNIHDDALQFEPIHRIVSCSDRKELIEGLKKLAGSRNQDVILVEDGREETIPVDCGDKLAVSVIQAYLNRFFTEHEGVVDYIHGEEAVRSLSHDGVIGLILPPVEKDGFFAAMKQEVFPRKTFSMGHAEEKRYYLEARQIRE
ncbi:MAG: DUF1015 domain-containing protein [Solobacterium sp.]|nr:DUF1015 domain-containing protein [Solobacterium sp.]